MGYSRREETCRRALDLGAVDTTAADLEQAAEADVVLLAPPVTTIKRLLADLAPHLAPETIVTDAASTKADVERWAQETLPAGVHWVGSHPMAGKETAGIDHADGNLFKGRTWCIVPPEAASAAAVEAVTTLASATGARTLTVDAQTHDRAVAAVSHLPFTVAAVIAASVIGQETFPAYAQIAGTGLRDMTRLASGDAIMHRDICLTNRDNLVQELERFSDHLHRTIDLLRRLPDADHTDGDPASAELGDYFQGLKQARDAWLDL